MSTTFRLDGRDVGAFIDQPTQHRYRHVGEVESGKSPGGDGKQHHRQLRAAPGPSDHRALMEPPSAMPLAAVPSIDSSALGLDARAETRAQALSQQKTYCRAGVTSASAKRPYQQYGRIRSVKKQPRAIYFALLPYQHTVAESVESVALEAEHE